MDSDSESEEDPARTPIELLEPYAYEQAFIASRLRAAELAGRTVVETPEDFRRMAAETRSRAVRLLEREGRNVIDIQAPPGGRMQFRNANGFWVDMPAPLPLPPAEILDIDDAVTDIGSDASSEATEVGWDYARLGATAPPYFGPGYNGWLGLPTTRNADIAWPDSQEQQWLEESYNAMENITAIQEARERYTLQAIQDESAARQELESASHSSTAVWNQLEGRWVEPSSRSDGRGQKREREE